MRVAERLGVSSSGLTRWIQAGESPHLRPVNIAEASSITTPDGKLVLVTPGGYRLEGLSASSAVSVLRRLAC